MSYSEADMLDDKVRILERAMRKISRAEPKEDMPALELVHRMQKAAVVALEETERVQEYWDKLQEEIEGE